MIAPLSSRGQRHYSPKNRRLATSSGLGPAGHNFRAHIPGEGRAPHGRRGRHHAKLNIAPFRPPASLLPIADNAMPRACVRPMFTDAQSASFRENRLSRDLRPLSARPSHLGSSTPWRGGLRTPARGNFSVNTALSCAGA